MNTSTPEKQYIIIPKNAVTDGSGPRNSFVDLLVRAGYDKVSKGFDRRDEINQGDFIFRGVKGADALATQFELFQGRPLGIIIGSDVLAEADIAAMSLGIRSDIRKLLTLDVGACRMRFLVPEERPALDPSSLEERLLFSKYPNLADRTLNTLGLRAHVRRSEGADTRVNDYREQNSAVGAFEIVGSGDTARQNKLQIVESFDYPTGDTMGLSYLDLNRITTDVYASNVDSASSRSREMLRELGLALESARQTNRYVTFKFNVPSDETPRFADLGMKGPTIAPVMTRTGQQPWSALEISVPAAEENRMRMELLRRGAEDLLSGSSLDAEPGAATSEVIRILPFESTTSVSEQDPQVRAAELQEVSSWMLDLAATIQTRAGSNDENSSTVRALKQGIQYCAPRFANEAQELSRAIRLESTENAIDEAGQSLYWYLVSLQSRGIAFRDVLPVPPVESNDESRQVPTDVERLSALLSSLDQKRPLVGSRGIAGEAVDYADDAVRFSSLLRKGDENEVRTEATASLSRFFTLLKIAGVDPVQVMKKERGH